MSEHPGSLPAEADSGPIGQILAYFETVSWIKWERTPHKVTGWIWLIWGGRESVRADWPNLKKNKSVLMLILFHPLLFDFLIWGDCEKKLGWSPTSTVSRSSTVGPGFKPVRTLGDFSLPGPVAFECTYCKSYNNEQSNNEYKKMISLETKSPISGGCVRVGERQISAFETAHGFDPHWLAVRVLA